MTDAASNVSPQYLREFLLTRLLVPAKSAPTPKALEKDLAPYFASRLRYSPSEWAAHVTVALKQLEDSGLTVKRKLTDAGRQAAHDFLGATPDAALKWPLLVSGYLVPKALGVEPAALAAKTGPKRDELFLHRTLPRCFDLGTPAPSTLVEALDRLAWSALKKGVANVSPVAPDFSRESVLQAVYAPTWQETKPKKGAALAVVLAAAALNVERKVVRGKKSVKADDVRQAIVNQWLARGESAAPAPTVPLSQFAEAVKRSAAALSGKDRFGEKVFIAPLWERFEASSEARGMSRTDFESRLVEANRNGLLTLSRADLVSAMDVEMVNRSEIRLPHMTYHLIRADR